MDVVDLVVVVIDIVDIVIVDWFVVTYHIIFSCGQ